MKVKKEEIENKDVSSLVKQYNGGLCFSTSLRITVNASGSNETKNHYYEIYHAVFPSSLLRTLYFPSVHLRDRNKKH